ncbi:hypothetical protein B0G62_111169 [Paraburkholderia eburnea]|uniref:Beta-barrel assembly machine subunit BamE n=1 Tax=Paraburkholderia eburnea TaxID=1189126 RepID=A0A2S4M474_9BURK|nr:hypothetical protein [Paraburkholderia eburnea]POR49500.1 hypothetical protein B0G62_111169 [Paraburkholderia eburnea]PRZ19870.1 hypothetical protein BX588_1138 [Paraburkholderia eburnea]
MNKVVCVALFAAFGLSACVSSPTPAPEVTMSMVKHGMSQNDVIARVGPPDRMRGENGNECYQYALGKYGDVPFAVYFRYQTVVASERGSCNLAVTRAAAGPGIAYQASDYAVQRR